MYIMSHMNIHLCLQLRHVQRQVVLLRSMHDLPAAWRLPIGGSEKGGKAD